MPDDFRSVLESAAAAGEIIRIVYRGGSQPGASREIMPLRVTVDEVLARDVATGIDKTFALSKIEFPGLGPQVAYSPQPHLDTRSIREAVVLFVRDLEAAGWHVEVSDHSASVHRLFKNGKPRKIPDVALSYEPFIIDLVDDFDGRGLREERRPSQRPYHVRSRRLEASRTFTALPRALSLFIEEAGALASQS